MIFIVVKFPVRPDRSEEWLALTADFTAATRAEPGNIMFEWSRSVEDPNEFVLIEGFQDGDAGAAHVGSAHFKEAMAVLPDAIAATPKIVNVEVLGDDWSVMAELKPRG
jgi:quinol monooxygenase YgiN